jgi:chemotaxis protein MotB
MAARGGKKIVIVKKKVAAGGGHHGGSWKVAYADFVTAMMAFFMVMWILGMDDKTKQAIEGYFANPVGYKKGFGAGSSPLSTGSAPTNVPSDADAHDRALHRAAHVRGPRQTSSSTSWPPAIRSASSTPSSTCRSRSEGLRIELVESGQGRRVLPIGSARMNAATMLTLQLVGTELAHGRIPVVLEGHTDARPSARRGVHELGAVGRSRQRGASRARVHRRRRRAHRRSARLRGHASRASSTTRWRPANRRISILLPFTNVPESAQCRGAPRRSKRDSLVNNLTPAPRKKSF